MELEKLRNLEGPRHSIGAIKPRDIKFHFGRVTPRRMTDRTNFEGIEARNDLINLGVEGALVLGKESDSFFKAKAGESLGTSVISHRREAMEAPRMIATILKGIKYSSPDFEGQYLHKCEDKDFLNYSMPFIIHSNILVYCNGLVRAWM